MSNKINPNCSEEQIKFVEDCKKSKATKTRAKKGKDLLSLSNEITKSNVEEVHTFAVDLGMLNTKEVSMIEKEVIKKDTNGNEISEMKKEFITNIFPSTLSIDEKCNNPFIINNHIVDFDSNKKVIGTNRSLEKNTLEHKMLLAKAMYNQYKNTNKTKFNIIVGCSLGDFLENKGQKTLDVLASEKYYTIEHEDEKITFEINKIVAMPETLTSKSVCRTNFNKLGGSNVFILDLGGLNFSIVKYNEDGKPVKDEIYFSNEGMNSIYSKLTSQCNMMGVRATDSKIEAMLRSQKIEDRFKEAFTKRLDTIFTNFLNLMEQRDYHKGESHIVFTGGGSQSLAPFISEYFAKDGHSFEIIKESIFANVKGMYKAGLKKLDQAEILEMVQELQEQINKMES